MLDKVICYRKGKISLNQYWDIKFRVDETSSLREEDCFDKFRFLLKESIKKRLISDVPLGVLLSGGIDSGSIVSLMTGLYSGKIKTFSIGFKEPSFDESVYGKFFILPVWIYSCKSRK